MQSADLRQMLAPAGGPSRASRKQPVDIIFCRISAVLVKCVLRRELLAKCNISSRVDTIINFTKHLQKANFSSEGNFGALSDSCCCSIRLAHLLHPRILMRWVKLLR